MTARDKTGKPAPKKKASGGRPSLADAGQIRDRILDAATALFFAEGYGATSIEAVAQQAGMSKRTFYHRFANKSDLFAAVVHRVMAQLRGQIAYQGKASTATPIEDLPREIGGKTLAEKLERIGLMMLEAALSPLALQLNRIVLSEGGRFPELAALFNRQGARAEAVRMIAHMLEAGDKPPSGPAAAFAPSFAAEQFMQLVISAPQRHALAEGQIMPPAARPAWVRQTVDLFLNGYGG